MNNRNRAEGWKYAKLSGHVNEDMLEEMMLNDTEFQKTFLARIGKSDCTIVSVNEDFTRVDGGIHEKNIPSVLDASGTKSKADMRVNLSDGTLLNISIKKSLSGQVYLITPDRFINGFEKQFNTTIPTIVKEGISLYWGTSDDVPNIINRMGTHKTYELRKHRLVAETLHNYNNQIYLELLNWFKNNMYEITSFCFSRGLAKDKTDWANIIWYINEIDDIATDEIYYIEDLCQLAAKNANELTLYGSLNGGTTIQLPFGFVQWHSPQKTIPGCMQFHHKFNNISDLFNK